MAKAPEQQAMFENRDGTEVLLKDLRVVSALCCSVTSLYCNFPEALGCKGSCEWLCCQCEETAFKCLDPSTNAQKICCVCWKGGCFCIQPKTCISCQEQVCCCDSRCAFPCTDEVPCIVNICGINCFADWGCKCGCCQTVAQLIPRLDDSHHSTAAKREVAPAAVGAAEAAEQTISWKESAGSYLEDYPPSVGQLVFETLEAAQAKAATVADCGGVTQRGANVFELRAGKEFKKSPAGEVSWLKCL